MPQTMQILDPLKAGTKFRIDGGVITNIRKYSVTVTLPSVADADTDGDDVTCPGVNLGDVVLGVGPASALDDKVLLSAHVKAADTVRVVITNDSTGAYQHPSETMNIWVLQ